MLGLCSNGEIKAVDLNLRGNDMRGAGAQVLEVCLPDLKNIASLDISDNGQQRLNAFIIYNTVRSIQIYVT